MAEPQQSLFDRRSYRGAHPSFAITPPGPDHTIGKTLPAYHAYLSSVGYSETTPDNFTADVALLGQFLSGKRLEEIQTADVQQWIGQLKQTMPTAKTVSRKVTAVRNYFRWLVAENVLAQSPAERIRVQRVTSPLPTLLYESECERLLANSSNDPRTYLLLLLLLETGLKKAELVTLRLADFDFSDQYQPELWVRHSGKKVFKDRRLKLPVQVIQVCHEYVQRYGVTDALFPFTARTMQNLLNTAAMQAGISKPVTASTLRDAFVVRSVKQRGMKLEDVLIKIGMSKLGHDDAVKKYSRLTSEAL